MSPPDPPRILITGASQGIGASAALAFAAAFPGARVALWARRREALDEVAARCRAAGAEPLPVVCDVTDETSVQRATDTTRAAFGALDVLINNAGLFEPLPFEETSLDAFRRQIDTNLTSAFLVTRAWLADLTATRGHVFFVASVASLQGYPRGAAYCAAKHGLLGLARSLRVATRERGLRVTTVMPGATRTASWDGTDLPDERFMKPEDIASAIVDTYRLSPRTVVEELVLRPQLGDI